MDAKSLINLSILCYWLSFGVFTSFWYFGFSERRTRSFILLLGVALQVVSLFMRGMAIEYFPLTNKFESFYAFSCTAFLVLLWNGGVENALYRMVHFAVGYGFLVAAAFWPKGLSYPPPLMLTIWYVLHVPLSFMCYALWTSSLAAGVAYFLSSTTRAEERGQAGMIALIDKGFLYGLLGFSVSMLFGGLWGYVAWGSYFLWDAKVVWSVIIWLFYSTCIHIDHWPALRGYKPHLAVAGFLIMMVTYVGTSFFISSSHRF
ncbi:MAG TPA: cytochrome c biogenesis protein CcsA [Candidatus Hypogeohydataceae bacterium YC38]|nr:cytochrome c biogenesis protein CcsA [Candidatus Brocadiales bacterium]